MVFVGIVLIASLIILLVLGVSDLVFFKKMSPYSNNLKNFFLNVNSNVIYLYIIVFLLAFGTVPFLCLAIATFVSFSYYQGFRSLMSRKERLLMLAAIPMDWSTSRLSKEAFLSTVKSTYKSLVNRGVTVLTEFKLFVSDTTNDFRIILGLYEVT
jgi:hypothetical protein